MALFRAYNGGVSVENVFDDYATQAGDALFDHFPSEDEIKVAFPNYAGVPVPPPPLVSRMQALVALSQAGLLDAVQNWVSSQDPTTQLIWNNTPTFSRNSTLLNGAGAALGLSAAQIDQLFIAAAKVNP